MVSYEKKTYLQLGYSTYQSGYKYSCCSDTFTMDCLVIIFLLQRSFLNLLTNWTVFKEGVIKWSNLLPSLDFRSSGARDDDKLWQPNELVSSPNLTQNLLRYFTNVAMVSKKTKYLNNYRSYVIFRILRWIKRRLWIIFKWY